MKTKSVSNTLAARDFVRKSYLISNIQFGKQLLQMLVLRDQQNHCLCAQRYPYTAFMRYNIPFTFAMFVRRYSA